MNERTIYLDHHATTPVDPRVLEAMLPYLKTRFGNAASRQHVYGWQAEEAVVQARKQIASLMNASDQEIIFSSGATESNNLAILGVAESYQSKGRHIITNLAEHSCVLEACRYLEKRGFAVTYLPVDGEGFVEPEAVRKAITSSTILISVMMANNEIGTVQPVAAIGRIAREHGVLFHSDIAQAFGKIAVDVQALNIDLASLSAHKCYASKGCGALFVRRRDPRVKLAPQLHGGGHEQNLRSGTLNVPGIVAFGAAAEIAGKEMGRDVAHTGALRRRLYRGLTGELDGLHLNGPNWETSENRLPNNLSIGFEGVDGEGLITAMKNVAVSTGSACTNLIKEPSHVLRAIGLSDEMAQATLRFGLGRFNTEVEIDEVLSLLIRNVKLLRQTRLVRT